MYEAQCREELDLQWLREYYNDHEDAASTSNESSNSSSSSSSSEEEDVGWEPVISHASRVEESRDFCERTMFECQLSEFERAHIHCDTEEYEEARRRVVAHPLHDKEWLRRNIFDAAAQSKSTPKQQQQQQTTKPTNDGAKELFIIHRNERILNFTIENYVHSTYFVNCHTGKLCTFNLTSLAASLIGYCVELSCKKFAKVNLRYLHALSHLLYTSSVLVETGSDNQHTSRYYLEVTLGLLRNECGYPNINIRERVCQNIVLTGQVNFPICLHVLSKIFPDASYKKKSEFSGAIIKLPDLERWFRNRDEGEEDAQIVGDFGQNEAEVDRAFLARVNIKPAILRRSGGGGGGAATDEEIASALKETDEYALLRPEKPLKGTFLIFGGGQIIFTGVREVKQACRGFLLLYKLVERCDGNVQENAKREAQLAAADRRHPSHR
jgi:TATA-box binding protein (TBP) (component of TFIID and TFIIIB)